MLSYELNSKILKLAPIHIAKPVAPDTLESLIRASVSPMVVYDGGSENTIYGDTKVNHAFRAWHDALHIKLNAPFTREGETLVGLEQARILGGSYSEIVMAEVVGQVEYFEKYRDFPSNQVEFCINYLKGKGF